MLTKLNNVSIFSLFIIDYFKNDINNMILSAPALYTVGIPGSSQSKNIGSMTNKGAYGWYWSSAQYGTDNGYMMYLYSGASYVTYSGKSIGASLRCIRP